MKALLFTGGENPDLDSASFFLRGADFVAAADSGVATALALGLRPDLIVGDMDSLPSPDMLGAFPESEVVRLVTAKDDSDTESALKILHGRGFSEITLVGGGGGRMDHLFAIERLFAVPHRPSLWLAGESAVAFLRAESGGSARAELSAEGLEKGDTVSVFPAGDAPHKIEAENLRWSLDIPWERGAYSLSNWAEAGTVTLRCGAGAFLCVFPLKKSLALFRHLCP